MVCVRVSSMSAPKPSAMGKVRAANQQEPELGYAQLLVKLRVAASSDVNFKGVRRLLDHVVVKSVSSRVHLERRRQVIPQVACPLRPPPLLAELSIHIPERLSNDGVRSLLAQFGLEGLYERNQNSSLNLGLFYYRNAHTSPLSRRHRSAAAASAGGVLRSKQVGHASVVQRTQRRVSANTSSVGLNASGASRLPTATSTRSGWLVLMHARCVPHAEQ